MKKHVKAQGLSLNTIVIAAIVLVVLIVVLAIFKGGINKLWPSLNNANNCKEIPPDYGCKPASDECKSGTLVYGLGCEEKKGSDGNPTAPYCCVKGPNS